MPHERRNPNTQASVPSSAAGQHAHSGISNPAVPLLQKVAMPAKSGSVRQSKSIARPFQLKPGMADNIVQQQPQVAWHTLRQGGVLQGKFLDIESQDFKGFVAEQEDKQADMEQNDSAFTTVGFEHEFAQTEEKSLLQGISHLELAKSRRFPYTNLPFILETDAANAIELVSPPFLIKTLGKTMIPDPVDLEKVDNMIRSELTELGGQETMGDMLDGFEALDLDFKAIENLTIESKNVSHKSGVKDYTDKANSKLEFSKLRDIPIKVSEKGGGITSQINFATNAATFAKMQEINKEKALNPQEREVGFNPKAIFTTLQQQILGYANAVIPRPSPNLSIFLNHMALTLSSQFATPAIEAVRTTQEEIYGGLNISSEPNKEKFAKFRFSANLSSAVKDVHGAWIKDSLMNIGLGILNKEDWDAVKLLVSNGGFKAQIQELSLPAFKNINGFEKDLPAGNRLIGDMLTSAKGEIISALKIIEAEIAMVEKDGRPSDSLAIVPVKPVGFMGHNKWMIGPRQDTYIDPRKAQLPDVKERLQVVETRRDGLETLYRLAMEAGVLDKKTLGNLVLVYTKKMIDKSLEIQPLQQKRAKIREEVTALQEEFTRKSLLVAGHDDKYPVALESYKEEYRVLNGQKEPGEKQLSKFKVDYGKEKTKMQARLLTITGQLKKLETEVPIRERNIDIDILKIEEEIRELRDIRMEIVLKEGELQ